MMIDWKWQASCTETGKEGGTGEAPIIADSDPALSAGEAGKRRPDERKRGSGFPSIKPSQEQTWRTRRASWHKNPIIMICSAASIQPLIGYAALYDNFPALCGQTFRITI